MAQTVILLVDPDVRQYNRLKTELKGFDVDLVLCDKWGDAVGLASEKIPSLVIVDVDLGDASGFLVYSKLKKIPELAESGFGITGTNSHKDEMQKHFNLKARANFYLIKPYGLEQLKDSFKKAFKIDLPLPPAPPESKETAPRDINDIPDTAMEDIEILEDMVETRQRLMTARERDRELEMERVDVAPLMDEITALKDRLKDEESKIFKLENDIEALRKEKDKALGEAAEYKGKMELVRDDYELLIRQNEMYKSALSGKDEELKNLQALISHKDSEIRENQDLIDRLSKLPSQEKVSEIKAELEKYKTEASVAKSACADLEEQLKKLKENSRPEDEYQIILEQLNAASKELDELNAQLAKNEKDKEESESLFRLATSDANKLKAELDSVRGELEVLRKSASEHSDLENVLSKLREEYNSAMEDRSNRLMEMEEQLLAAKKSIFETEKKAIKATEDLAKYVQNNNALQKQVKELEMTNLDMRNSVEDMKEQLAVMQSEKASAERNMFELEQEKESLQKTISELKEIRAESERLKLDVNAKSNKISALELENRMLVQEKDRGAAKIRELETEGERLKKKLEETQEEFSALMQEKNKIAETLFASQQENAAAKSKISDLEKELAAKSVKIADMEKEISDAIQLYESKIKRVAAEGAEKQASELAKQKEGFEKEIADLIDQHREEINKLIKEKDEISSAYHELQEENSHNEERVITAYQRIKNFEQFRQKVSKAVNLTIGIIEASINEDGMLAAEEDSGNIETTE